MATVEEDFHIHIDHYAWIGLLGLVNLINQVGGIDVVATNPVMDDFYPADLTGKNPYAYERVAVLPGPQHMDGMQALMYVRSRHGDLRSDFGRSQRQQQVLLALRAKAKLLGIADLPDIATAMANDIPTDMSISEIASLLPIASSVQLQNVHQVILASPYTYTGHIANEDVLLPNLELHPSRDASVLPRGVRESHDETGDHGHPAARAHGRLRLRREPPDRVAEAQDPDRGERVHSHRDATQDRAAGDAVPGAERGHLPAQ